MRTIIECAAFTLAKNRSNYLNSKPVTSDHLPPKLGSHLNEDHFEYLTNATDWTDFAAIVADGVGSSGTPRDAAITAAKSWLAHVQAKFVENSAACTGFDEIHFNEITTHAFLQAHEAVQQESKGSACAVSACVQGERLMVGCVGDCRAYRISSGQIELLTKDQVDESGDPTQVVGGKRVPQAFASSNVRLKSGDVIILCTDGVWKLLSPAEIQRSAVNGSADQVASRLQQMLNTHRSATSDDATAVIAVVKRIGRPFWENNPGGDQVKDDLIIDTKINEVLAELLNRLRAPIEKQNVRAEQTLAQLNSAVQELRDEIDSIRESGGRGKSSIGFAGIFGTIALSLLLVFGGIMIGRTSKDQPAKAETRVIKPQLPEQSKVVSQQYINDRLLITFVGADKKEKLAVFRLEDGGQPYAIIDRPTESKPDVPVP
jgi:protein phosphatase